MQTPSPLEQYMLELVNRARMDPVTEAQLHQTSLSSGQAGSKQPLAFTPTLLKASGDYSQRMIDEDFFDHQAPDGSTMSQRVFDAGWTSASGGWSLGENISWYGSFQAGFANQPSTIDSQHRGLFRSSGHRNNILDEDFSEIGIGQVQGAFTDGGTTYPHTSMITQNFADGGRTFLTGVAIADGDEDSFYDPGEGLGGVQVSANGSAGSFSTTTWSAGGYSLELPDGFYQVTFTGGGLPSPVTRNVDIDGENEKLDVILGESVSDEIIGGGGKDSLVGTSGADQIFGEGGADQLFGKGLRDDLYGGAGSDSLRGDEGADRIWGQAGNDTGFGGKGADSIHGGTGSDHLVGGSGRDQLFGGANGDFLNGGSGADTMAGGAGQDTYAVDRPQDLIRESAGGGVDWVRAQDDYTLPEGGSQDFVEHLQFLGQEDAIGRGNDLDNSLLGNNGDNVLHGQKGDDGLYGRAGDDELRGGGGDNRLYGGLGDDTLFLERGDRAWGATGKDWFRFDGDEGLGSSPIINDFSGLKLNQAGDRDRFVFSSGLESGDFSYRGAAAFEGEGDSQARYAGAGRVEVDLNGDADADLSFKVNGLNQANQLTAVDFVWLG